MLRAIAAALADVQTIGSEISSEISLEKIIALITKDERISAKAMAEKLDISARAVEKQVAKLKVGGKLQRIGGAKGGQWWMVEI